MAFEEPKIHRYRLYKKFLLISISTISLLGILNFCLSSDKYDSSRSISHNCRRDEEDHDARGGKIFSTLKKVREKLLSSGMEEDQQFLYDRPLVILSKGCSGSSAVHRQIIEILKEHGLQAGAPVDEMLIGYKNPVYVELMKEKGKEISDSPSIKAVNNDVMIESLQKIQEKFKTKRRIFTFKVSDVEYKGISLQALNPVMVAMYRDNHFDRCICSVRDCFDKHLYGYPVFAVNNTKTDLCFKRRKYPEVKVKAYLYDDSIVDCIHSNEKESATIEKLTTTTVLESNLFAYEYSDDEDAFHVSLSEWTKLLEPFLQNVLSIQKVAEYLSKFQNTRPIPFHDDVVQNIDVISNVLRAHGFGEYLRLDEETVER